MKIKLWIWIFLVFVMFLSSATNVVVATDGTGGGGNSYFQRFFLDGKAIVWFVLMPLSVVTFSLIVQYFLVIRRSKLLPPTLINRMQQLENAKSALEELQQQDNFLSRTLVAGLALKDRDRDARDHAMFEALEQQSTSMLRKIEWLNIIGNVAPMIGLFGTVWGMIEAFNRIVQAQGQPEPERLAGAISIALVTTLWGLFTAIPALAAYGSLRNRIDAITAETSVAAETLIGRIPSPDRKGGDS